MLARIGSAPVKHEAGFQCNVIGRRELLILPVAGQLVVAVDGDVPHAANEAFRSVDAAADHVVRSSGEVKDPLRLGLLVVNGQDGVVLGHCQLNCMPFSIAVSL